MEQMVFELLSGLTSTVSFPLILNIALAALAYYLVKEGMAWMNEKIVYKRIRYKGLGYGAHVLWEGELFKIDDISWEFRSVTLKNRVHQVNVPLIVWVNMPKKRPLNGYAEAMAGDGDYDGRLPEEH